VGVRVAPQSIDRITHKIRRLTRRNIGRSLEQIRDSLNPVIIGWTNYYALADAKGHMERVDEHLRRRLRQIVWKQWKTPKKRYQSLRELGVSEYWAKRTAGTSKGNWRLSASPPLHQALNNVYWERLGLKSFSKQYQLRHT
jgi:RNA-directed DNA polymerase